MLSADKRFSGYVCAVYILVRRPISDELLRHIAGKINETCDNIKGLTSKPPSWRQLGRLLKLSSIQLDKLELDLAAMTAAALSPADKCYAALQLWLSTCATRQRGTSQTQVTAHSTLMPSAGQVDLLRSVLVTLGKQHLANLVEIMTGCDVDASSDDERGDEDRKINSSRRSTARQAINP